MHLLLGIKTTNPDPVWIKTLPSGVAVYQSVIKDIWSSDLIFAGPHKSFTNKNTSSNVNHVIFGIHYTISTYEDKQDGLTDEREYVMVVALGLTVHPFLFNPQDILDVGGEINPDFKELVNSCNHIMKELDPTYSHNYCGVHKAIIPIARMRELVDEDDTADTITHRCPECSKCVVCKRSLRKIAISLKESAEQSIIESIIVKLHLENKRVLVRDPVQPLIDKHQPNIHQALCA